MRRRTAIAWLTAAVAGLVLVGTSVSAAEAPAASGMELYNAKCAMCHGKDGVAKPMAKPSANLNDAAWQKGMSVDAIATVTAEGKNKMPKFADKLTPEQVKAVAEYVLTLK
jgi:mono/diheme cytochrome c family protein